MPIKSRIKNVQNQIQNFSLAANRNPNEICLLAVSKTKPASDIAEAYRSGLRHFGENYCQEALTKQTELTAYDITWHFIGPIQSNKTKLLATHFSWVHSVESLRIAKRLSEQRPDHLGPLNICLQVNISGETSKSGISLAELPQLCAEIKALPRINLRGVMAIPAQEADYEKQRAPYRLLKEAVSSLNQTGMDTFSYGMSGDLQAAITEGATIVRIGTAIFGERN